MLSVVKGRTVKTCWPGDRTEEGGLRYVFNYGGGGEFKQHLHCIRILMCSDQIEWSSK